MPQPARPGAGIHQGKLAQEVALAFSSQGALARSDPSLAQREVQQRLAEQVALAIEAARCPGRGGRYRRRQDLRLSGAACSAARAVTRPPRPCRTSCSAGYPAPDPGTGVAGAPALLKGRSSYLCLHRMTRRGAGRPPAALGRTLARIESWSQVTRSGDLAELPGLDERSPAIPLVTSTRDNCLGTQCPTFRDCHVNQARREAWPPTWWSSTTTCSLLTWRCAKRRGRVAAHRAHGGFRRGAPAQ